MFGKTHDDATIHRGRSLRGRFKPLLPDAVVVEKKKRKKAEANEKKKKKPALVHSF